MGKTTKPTMAEMRRYLKRAVAKASWSKHTPAKTAKSFQLPLQSSSLQQILLYIKTLIYIFPT